MTIRRLFISGFLFALFAFALIEAVDPDMWWHLRTGAVIVTDGIPRTDIFSFTVPDHRWVTHEWLSQVIMWLVYQAGGFAALIGFFATIITLTFWLVYRRCAGQPYFAAGVTLFAALASSLTWGSRPQMFNLLFLALFVFIVEGVRERTSDPRGFWLLPLATILWANLHSGYLLGIVLLAVYTIGDALQLRFGPRMERGLEWQGVRWLAAMAASSLVASLLNANGIQLLIYPFQTLGSDVMQTRINEWHSPDFHQSYTWGFGLFILLGVWSWAVGGRRPAWAELLLFSGTMVAGLVSLRHIPIFAIVAAPIIARNLYPALSAIRLPERFDNSFPRLLAARIPMLLIWVLLLLVVTGLGWRWNQVIHRTETLTQERFPVAAVDFLQREGLQDKRVFNSYNWGGYLIWRGVPVFVDGRADVYGDQFLRDYFRAFSLSEQWRQPLDAYDAEYALLEGSGRLATVMEASSEWREVYRDDVARIFARQPDDAPQTE